MPVRPTSITVICWIIIVFGVLGALSMLVFSALPEVRAEMAKSPLPVPVQFALSFTGLALTTLCGSFMLGGRNWARWVYVAWNAFGFVISIFIAPNYLAMLPGLIFFGIIALFLFQPRANEFFKSQKVEIAELTDPGFIDRIR